MKNNSFVALKQYVGLCIFMLYSYKSTNLQQFFLQKCQRTYLSWCNTSSLLSKSCISNCLYKFQCLKIPQKLVPSHTLLSHSWLNSA